jgi:phenylalanyl-tRNA synthetase alpha chain
MEIKDLKKLFLEDIKEVRDVKALEQIRVKYLGREGGELTKVLRSLKDLPMEKRRKIGSEANALRQEIEQSLTKKLNELKTESYQLKAGAEIAMPAKKVRLGHLHPLTQIENQIKEIFLSMNFSVVEGPEIETEYYNFDALNIPKDHPARDAWNTFWLRSNQKQGANGKSQSVNDSRFAISDKLLLRTHTSPIQIHYMERHRPPFQIIGLGRAFRYEAIDASHEINFEQLEGLMVGKDISLANFKFVVEEFFKRFFSSRGGSAGGGKEQKIDFRFIPSYFPFVEPGLQVDIKLKTKNSKLKTNWLEVAGAGMVHPNVFKAVGYNPREWQGFAFGFGPERLAMIKYNIPDIRLFYSGDLRFIEQF